MFDPLQKQQMGKILADWKLTPATFAHKISRGSWIPKQHLMYISMRVAQAIARGNGRIIISAPPRHGKSQLTSIYTPAWALEKYPDRHTIIATYGADLSVGFGRQVRDMFTDPQNAGLLNTKLRRDAQRVANFVTDRGGSMSSVGIGGPITGRGAHILLIDDYIKEIKEALSPAYRDYCWNWFTTTAYTRLEPGGTCIIIATRWHSDDLIGRILANLPGWEYIEIPAIAEEGDLLGRAIGEPLFPERYPLERLEELRESLGSIFFQALFQQKPVDESKQIADAGWLKITPTLPPHIDKFGVACRAWDLAATQDGGDYTVGTHMILDTRDRNIYITNIVRDQLSPEQVERKVQATAISDGEDTKIYIEQEPGSSGIALIDHYSRNVLNDFKVEGVPVVKAKVVRAQPFLAAAEAGKVFLLEGAWNNAFIKEFGSFPGAYDDQIDTAAVCYQKLTGKKVFSASWGRKAKSSTANSVTIRRAQFRMGSGTKRIRGATFGR